MEPIALCYHAVSEDWPAALSVTPRQFESQIALLAARGFRGVTFTEAATGKASGKVAAVTFDDGYRSVTELARPILDRHGFPATVFVPTRFIDSGQPLAWPGTDRWLGGPHQHELQPMSWEQLRALAAAGWEIGSHTLTHPRLTSLETRELREELVESRGECSERLGSSCASISFPYGDVDDRVLSETRAAGYSAAGLLATQLDRSSPIAFPRIGIYHVDGRVAFRVKVSPTARRLRRSRLWLPIARLLHRVRPS